MGAMDFWQETNWFAIQTKPYQENLAAAHVANLDLQVFLPRFKREQLVCGIARSLTRALFPGYFFARFCPLLSLDAVRYASGVIRVLGNSRCPVPIPPEIIVEIQNYLGSDGFVRMAVRRFQQGDPVAIEEGPFAGWMGRVEQEWDDGKRLVILLEALQQARVLVEKRCLSLTT